MDKIGEEYLLVLEVKLMKYYIFILFIGTTLLILCENYNWPRDIYHI